MNMKPSELFGVVVRTVSFIVIIYGLWNMCGAIDNVVENIVQANQGSDAELPPTFPYFAFGLPALVFGVVGFFCADWIVKLAYRDSSS
jgi:uncharacterized membrane protein